MGWTSSGDPYSHVGESALNFDSEDAAKSFAERHGWEYAVKLIGILFHIVFLKDIGQAPIFSVDVPLCQNATCNPNVKLY